MGRDFPNMPPQMMPNMQPGVAGQPMQAQYFIPLPQYDVEAFKNCGEPEMQKQFVGDIIYNLINPVVGEL